MRTRSVRTKALFELDRLEDFSIQLLKAAGVPSKIARVASRAIISSDLAGHTNHGLARLPDYLSAIVAKKIIPGAEPIMIRRAAGRLAIDGQFGLGHYTLVRSVSQAISEARRAGFCVVTMTRTNHFGRLGYYVELAAKAGLVAMLTTGTGNDVLEAVVAPHGGSQRLLGTNPIAFGFPRLDSPVVVDISTSAATYYQVADAAAEFSRLPAPVILRRDLALTNNPQDFFDDGAILPFGSHKGYALGLAVCMLGSLSGEFDENRGRIGGTSMILLDVRQFCSLRRYRLALQTFCDFVRKSHRRNHAAVLIPGDRANANRKINLEHGVPMSKTSRERLNACALELGVSQRL